MSPSFFLLSSFHDRWFNTTKFWPPTWGYCRHRDWSPGWGCCDSSPCVLSVYQKEWRVWWPFFLFRFSKANCRAWEREGDFAPVSAPGSAPPSKYLLLGTNSCGSLLHASWTPLSWTQLFPSPSGLEGADPLMFLSPGQGKQGSRRKQMRKWKEQEKVTHVLFWQS